MEKIEEQLNNLSLVDIPVEIHQSVMRKVNYQRIKPVLFTAFVLLVLNFLMLSWRINVKLADAEFVDMVQDFFAVFNFNFSFINTIFESFFEIISPAFFLSAFMSLVGAIYIGSQIKLNVFQFRSL